MTSQPTLNCVRCQDTRWVCEEHPDKPMGHNGCKGAGGDPCPLCNKPDGEIPDIRGAFDTITAAVPEVRLPRGRYLGTSDGPPVDEAEHFGEYPLCGAWVDRRDLGAVLDHQGPLPHPTEDRPQ